MVMSDRNRLVKEVLCLGDEAVNLQTQESKVGSRASGPDHQIVIIVSMV